VDFSEMDPSAGAADDLDPAERVSRKRENHQETWAVRPVSTGRRRREAPPWPVRSRAIGSCRIATRGRESRKRFTEYSAEIEGYEYYSALADNIARHGPEQFNGFLADLQVWGSPEQVTEKLLDYVQRCDAGALVVPLSFGGMSTEESHACFDLFARACFPSSRSTTWAATSASRTARPRAGH